MLATYRSHGEWWTAFGAVFWQPTDLVGVAGPSLELYVGNLQVWWRLLDCIWGCRLATYRSLGPLGPSLGLYVGNLAAFGAVGWQPTDVVGVAGPSLELYVGNLQVS